jgi:site-specific recombinase XerD
MVEIQWLAGMRPTEVAIMRTIDLNTSGSIWEYRPSFHKLDHHDVERIVMIGPRAQQILKPWLRADMEAYLFSPAETLDEFHAARTELRKTPWPKKGRENRPKVRNRKRPPRDRYDVTSYRRAIARACDLAFLHPELSNIPKKALTGQQRADLAAWRSQHRWSPNQLRHAAATLVRREMGIDSARAILGHSDADTTVIYAERDKELARVAMQKLG